MISNRNLKRTQILRWLDEELIKNGRKARFKAINLISDKR